MKLFLDTSVLLAACGSEHGASRDIFRRAAANGWVLVASPYVVGEVVGNLWNLPPGAAEMWPTLLRVLVLMDGSFYGLRVVTPGVFLEQERAIGRLF